MSRRKSLFHVRTPSWRTSLSARTSSKRALENALGLKAPRGLGWVTHPKRAAYNRAYNRRTISLWSIISRLFQ